MPEKLKVFGLAGSLRKSSFNMALLKAAKKITSDLMEIDIFERLREITPYDQDREHEVPDAVREMKERIRASDAVLIATPEYNYSIPGVLKNAIDWASRPYGDSAWEGKPAAIMSASVGMIGGARAQYHLRQTFVFLNMFPLNRPEVIVPIAGDKMDTEGNLTDSHTREKIKELLEALAEWTINLKKEPRVAKEEYTEDYPYEYAYRNRTGAEA